MLIMNRRRQLCKNWYVVSTFKIQNEGRMNKKKNLDNFISLWNNQPNGSVGNQEKWCKKATSCLLNIFILTPTRDQKYGRKIKFSISEISPAIESWKRKEIHKTSREHDRLESMVLGGLLLSLSFHIQFRSAIIMYRFHLFFSLCEENENSS